jgi:phosphatidylinositol alpha-1,6-mannosyltransferase
MASNHLLVSEIFPPQTGGSGRWLWEIYRRFPDQRVAVAAGLHPEAEAFDATHSVPVQRIALNIPDWGLLDRSARRAYWSALANVRRLAKAEGAGAIHCGRALPEGWIAWMLRQWSGIPYICYTHGEELNYATSSRQLAWMLRRVLKGADFIIANSRNTQAILQDVWCVQPERIRLLHPGVDTNYFEPADRDLEARRNLGWGDRPVVLTVGRLQERKGQDTMIRSTALVRKAIPDVLYAIVGDGDDRARLEALVDELNLRANVQFVGECDDARLLSCYQQCDLFVLANRQVGQDIEGFGMVLLEAQACGKPVLAGDSGGTGETMDSPRTGMTLDCSASEPLAAAVLDLLQDPARRARMGVAARQWTVNHFDWDALASQAAELFGMSLAADEPQSNQEPAVDGSAIEPAALSTQGSIG